MLDTLTIETFEPLVGSTFWLYFADDKGTHKVELRLTKAAKVMESEAARLDRNPFSVYFLAPMYLPQRIYRITHEAFAEPLDMFLVPVGKEPGGYAFEAVFT